MKKFLLLLILSSAQILGQQVTDPQIPFAPRSYVCYRTDSPLIIDGKLDDASWQKAAWTDDFVDIEGAIRPVPRFRTHAKMLWDEQYLYVAAELDEPDIWATLTERDAVIFYDNDFEVFIDPDGDTHQYYEFEMNALNTVWDLLLIQPYRDGGPAVNAWDIKGLKSGVAINGTINKPGDVDRSWTVEIAFPWHVLKECAQKNTPPKSGDQWRLNFSRVEWQTNIIDGKYTKRTDTKTGKSFPEDNWVWSPQGLINMHCPEMWGFVQFSEKITGTETELFVQQPEEQVKWVLRQIYYGEKKFFEKQQRYASTLGELGLDTLKAGGYSVPVIEATTTMYDASVKSLDQKTSWHITQDGRTWKK
jgi:hypothetical protein